MANPEAPRSPDGPSPSNPSVTRRQVLGGIAGVAGLAARPVPARGLLVRPPTAAPTRAAPHRSRRPRPPASGIRLGRRRRPAQVTLGSNYSDAVPKGVQAGRRLRSRRRPASRSRSTRPTTARSRTRSARTSRARRTTSSPGSPGFRMRFFAAQGLATDISDVWAKVGAQLQRRLQGRVDRRRRQAVLHPDLPLPVGRLLPQERLRGQGLHDPDDVRRVQDARHEDAGGRPDPDRLRRQGRLARDGHVRHHQPALRTATTSTSA